VQQESMGIADLCDDSCDATFVGFRVYRAVVALSQWQSGGGDKLCGFCDFEKVFGATVGWEYAKLYEYQVDLYEGFAVLGEV
jgi:hypothetical protein